MGWFSKRIREPEKEIEIEIKEPAHVHVWKDMPWYMIVEYNEANKEASYEIIEPYLCVTCGKRENKLLEKNVWNGISPEERDKIYKDVQKKYKAYLKPRAVVEDMINNILMVKDPGYLEMVEKMRGLPHSGCGTSSQMKKSDFQINLEDNNDNT